ncbi:MAG: 30S ribosomal protein S7 [Dehalococcoidia bacterium]|jgi:small subunit ribosomal protein S7|uniref:30S ribosomal protein S7 n=1 Tax=Candidatus Amarobacter glycogenicus TaxID=3140699 RepID=UPI001E07400A|nr:30S ribosomal protein S7 [Dehalococcoidia bacterium]MBK6563457.1 30S ribosomal protein S7 [Dehalococcoidia bacterium]MBK7127554.1 30S ribosomal protein S7 [Dehalococcoidia bacterium]MBK7330265.1 30S ribosomal protein S7 [Dehalococcoidia bacterium]MBK7724820.1 30S ribosomal protein S7 [Dehalococcoidia bacterium]
MARRNRPERRPTLPDARFNSSTVQVLINKVMTRGKKSTAERVVYGAFDRIQTQTGRDPLDVFQQAVRNTTPVLEVKPRRVGGATYQVPVEIRADRRLALSMRWLLTAARSRNGRSMSEKLASEFLDAANNTGAAIKRRDDTHRMAEANRAFVHYRW